MKNVILVEDNKIERRNISFALEQIEGIRLVKCFSNGLDAFQHIKANKTDIVITDVQMPIMDGIELIQEIKSNGIETEIIIVSAYDDFTYAKSAIDFGVVGYVMKPIIDDELQVAVEKAVSRVDEKEKWQISYNMLKKQYSESRQLLLSQFVKKLVTDNLSAEYIESTEEVFEINISKGYKAVFVMWIKDRKDKDDMVFPIADNIFESLFERKDHPTGVEFFPFSLYENEVGVIAVADDQDVLLPAIIDKRNMLAYKYNLDLYVSVSSISANVTQMRRLYKECKRVLKNQGDKNFILLYNELHGSSETDAQSNFYESVKHYIMQNDFDNVAEFLRKSIASFDEGNILRKKNFAYCFVSCLETILNDCGYTFEDIGCEKMIWNKLADFDSIVNLENYLINLSKFVIEKIHGGTDEKVDIVKQVMTVIHNRYMEHITVQDVARTVNYSRQHLDRIFANRMGMTVYDYLTQYRMKEAKKMLREGMDVKLVSARVGYNSEKHFSEKFKEFTSYSPHEYKNK